MNVIIDSYLIPIIYVVGVLVVLKMIIIAEMKYKYGMVYYNQTIEDIIDHSKHTKILGEWYIKKPQRKPFLMRIADAWFVLINRQVAVSFMEDNIKSVIREFKKG